MNNFHTGDIVKVIGKAIIKYYQGKYGVICKYHGFSNVYSVIMFEDDKELLLKADEMEFDS
jgi:ribosomal protein L21E